jgi:hypothetical protein
MGRKHRTLSPCVPSENRGAVWPGYDLCVNEGSTEADHG